MCGITGFWDTTSSTSSDVLNNIVMRMCEQIIHRGPDDWGSWNDPQFGIALGFRRLAILDLTPTGHQPMHSKNDRYVIIFNGEIYNFAVLRSELSTLGYTFHGTSDTEILLAAINAWGLLHAVNRLNGMFAFALWDRSEKTLSLVRDRLGIKPLYYGWSDKTFIFGSELKALRAHPNFKAEIDRNALALFLRYSYIPAPYTIYRGINKLPSATILTINTNSSSLDPKITPYWSAKNAAINGFSNLFSESENETMDNLEKTLTRSIGLRMVADVPLGAFLSGGIDSSIVVALMQKQSSHPVRTFTIGFNEGDFDEARYAKAVANHLRTSHTELYVSPEEARSIIPQLPGLYDEPFADPSQIPTFLISKLARRQVTVCLSGDGGDELFGGYNRYLWVQRIWNQSKHLHPYLRRLITGGIDHIQPQYWKKIINLIAPTIPNPADKIKKYSEALTASGPDAIYKNLVSHWKNPASLVINGYEPKPPLSDDNNWAISSSLADCMMFLDQVTYLPDDVLVKVDRASMGTSLEVRAPFLDDHETVEFAWRLPPDMKIRNGQGKWILRQLLKRYIPIEMFDRPKMGFGVPIDSWLRAPLKAWANNLLEEKRLIDEGYFHPSEILQKWREHQSGVRNWQYELWNILMFQAWLESNHP